MHGCMVSRFSHVQLFATSWTVAHQAPLSMWFSSQEYWSEFPLESVTRGIFPTQWSNSRLLWLLHCRQILYCWATREEPFYSELKAKGYIIDVAIEWKKIFFTISLSITRNLRVFLKRQINKVSKMSSTWDNIKSLVQMQYTKSFLSNHPDKDMHPYIYNIYNQLR